MIHLVGVPVLRKNHKIKTTLLKLQARAVFSPCPYKGEINIDTTISFISFQYLLKNGIIDTADVLEKAQEMKKQELINMNPWEMYQGKDSCWYVYLPSENDSQKRGKRVKRKDKKDLENFLADYWKEKSFNPTVEEVFNEWNDRRCDLGNIAQSTHERNQQTFNRHYTDFGKRKIKSLEPRDIQDFLESEIGQKELTSKAFSNLKSITVGFLKYAKREQYISFNVKETVDDLDVRDSTFKKTVKEDYEEVFDELELPKFTKYLAENADIVNLGIMLMLVTGIRVGELAALKWDDYDGNGLKIRRTETRYQVEKGQNAYEIKDFPKTAAGARYVIIPEDCLWIMKKLKAMNPFTEFIFMKKGKRLNTVSFRNRQYRICKKIGCYPKSPHKLRKTYASLLSDYNVDPKMTIEQMGHTNISCTQGHYFRNRKSLSTKTAILSSIPELQIAQKK